MIRIISGATSFALAAASIVAARGDPSTVGLVTSFALGAIVALPFIAAALNAGLGRNRSSFFLDAVIPALTTFAGVLVASLGLGAWGLQWLWVTPAWSLPAAFLGYFTGKRLRTVFGRRNCNFAP